MQSYLAAFFAFKPLMQFIVALIGALGIWFFAALQHKENVEKAADGIAAKRLLETIAKASERGAEQPDFVKAVREMPNAELRATVAGIAAELRLLQIAFNNERDAIVDRMHGRGSSPGTSDTQTLWEEGSIALSRQMQSSSYKFQIGLRPKTLALRDEISRRTGIPVAPGSVDHRSVAIDLGQLVGANPLTAAADYLESEARKL